MKRFKLLGFIIEHHNHLWSVVNEKKIGPHHDVLKRCLICKKEKHRLYLFGIGDK